MKQEALRIAWAAWKKGFNGGWSACLRWAWKKVRSEYATISTEEGIEKETEKAIMVVTRVCSGVYSNIWLPKSVVVKISGTDIVVKSWFLEKNFHKIPNIAIWY
jgi:hypothetical protein